VLKDLIMLIYGIASLLVGIGIAVLNWGIAATIDPEYPPGFVLMMVVAWSIIIAGYAYLTNVSKHRKFGQCAGRPARSRGCKSPTLKA